MITFINLNETKQEHLSFDRKGQYLVFFHNMSGKFTFELKASGVELDIYGLFTGKKSDQFVVETIQHHVAPSSVSNLSLHIQMCVCNLSLCFKQYLAAFR